jgi:hypothetical protein
MGVSGSFIKIGAVFFAAVIFAAVVPSKSAYAQTSTVTQTRTVTQTGTLSGFPFRGFNGGFGRFNGGFGRFNGGFGGVYPAVPSNQGITHYGVPPPPDYGVPAQPYYGVSRPGQSSTSCYLHRQVDTPKGPVLEPVYLC